VNCCRGSRCRCIQTDPPDRVRPLCGTELQEARARQAGDLPVPGLCAHLRQISTRRLPDWRKSRRDRMRATFLEIKEALGQRRHVPVPEVGRSLAQVVAGYLTPVPTNSPALSAFRYHVAVLWHRQLCRRSQRAHVVGRRWRNSPTTFSPKPHILHPWPSLQFAVTRLR
jgi:hypothetical protein